MVHPLLQPLSFILILDTSLSKPDNSHYMSTLVGRQLGKYQILERVGRGGMAEVYKAYQASLNRYVAVKVMLNHLADDETFIERFEREATSVARLRHPNIIRIHDFDIFQDNKTIYYMVMEFIEGSTLKEELEKRMGEHASGRNGSPATNGRDTAPPAPYALSEIAYILTALASGLDYAHAQGVVHRDLKPANIMFTPEGQVVIADFGLVRLLNKPSYALPGIVTGTPAYMSPEQAQGEDVDHRSDIYSLGVVLHELITGKTPFHGDTPFSIIMKQASAAPLTLPDHPHLTAEMRTILETALAHDPDDRYPSAGAMAKALRAAIGITLDDMAGMLGTSVHLPAPQTQPAAKRAAPGRMVLSCPYRGLFAFREEDAKFFFGREAFTDRMLAALQAGTPLLPVIGPSGSGKSSVIFAGLVPHLRRESDWLICSFRPGNQPLNALAAALLPFLEPSLSEIDRLVETRHVAQMLQTREGHLTHLIQRILQRHEYANHILLVIDQFEELYTLCPEADIRRRFLDLLTAERPGEAFFITLSLRADFLGAALAHPRFAGTIQTNPLILGPMTRTDLSHAIEKPAEKQGAIFESGLVERILDDVGSEPGNLPLLEFALTTLWDRQVDGRLTHTAYDAIGRVDGALARHAEDVYARLSEKEKAAARRIFTQLVRPGDNTEDTRRLTTKAEIGAARWALVQKLADARLVVTNRDPEAHETVEIVHEALIRSWTRLRGWMETDRNFRLWQERLRAALYQWEENERDAGALLRGVPLEEAEEWLTQRREELTGPERAFIETAVQAREAERRARERLRTRITAGLVIGLVVTLALAIVSFVQRNNALAAQEIALRERDQAQNSLSRQLAIQANALLDTDFDLTLLLSVAAYETADTFAARQALLNSINHYPRLKTFLRGHAGLTRSIAYQPSGNLLASGGINGDIILWDTQTRTSLATLEGHKSLVRSLAFSPDGQILASASSTGGILLWRVSQQEPLGALRQTDPQANTISAIAFHPDGDLLAAGSSSGTIILWDVNAREPAGILEGHTRNVTDLAFSADGRLLASSSVDATAIVWNLRTRRPHFDPITGHDGIIWTLAFHPDNSKLSTGGNDGRIITWDTTTGRRTRAILRGHTGWVTSLTYSPDGTRLISGGRDNTILVWDLVRQSIDIGVGKLRGHEGIVWQLAYSPDGETLASTGEDGQLILWNVQPQPRTGPLAEAPLKLHSDWVRDLAYDPNGETLVSGSKDGTLVFWDMTADPPSGRPFFSGTPINALAYSSDGRLLATGGENGNIILWDAELRRVIGTPLRGHAGQIWALVFSPDNKILASAGADGNVILWDTTTREPLGTPIEAHAGAVWTLAFSTDGQILASGGADSDINLWNVTTRAALGPPLKEHNSAVTSLAFSPDGDLLASAGEDRAILLWDAREIRGDTADTNEPPKPINDPLVGHERRINALTFSPDSRLLASGSTGTATVAGVFTDDIIILWDVETLRPLGPPFLSQHGRVFALAFSPDGRFLASGGWDTTILLWDAEPTAWQRTVCDRLHRDFTPEEWNQFLGGQPYEPICEQVLSSARIH